MAEREELNPAFDRKVYKPQDVRILKKRYTPYRDAFLQAAKSADVPLDLLLAVAVLENDFLPDTSIGMLQVGAGARAYLRKKSGRYDTETEKKIRTLARGDDSVYYGALRLRQIADRAGLPVHFTHPDAEKTALTRVSSDSEGMRRQRREKIRHLRELYRPYMLGDLGFHRFDKLAPDESVDQNPEVSGKGVGRNIIARNPAYFLRQGNAEWLEKKKLPGAPVHRNEAERRISNRIVPAYDVARKLLFTD